MITSELVLKEIRLAVRGVVQEIAPEAVVSGIRLADLGCSSIDRADIVTQVMERLSVVVPVSEFHSGLTIGELADIFQKHA
jgi:polyketide biosynthesis acyl carrier protein